jgi:cytochrome P450
VRADPYPYYRLLREKAPVLWSPQSGCWIVSRYDDGVRLLGDPRVCHWAVSDEPRSGPEYFPQLLARWLTSMDPRTGARLRKLTTPVFLRPSLDTLGDRIHDLADRILDEAKARGALEVVEDLAGPIALATMANVMGVPDERAPEFKRLANGVVSNLVLAVEAVRRPRDPGQASTLVDFLRSLLDEARPGAPTTLVGAMREMRREDHTVDEDELVAFLLLFLFAGRENMMNFIGNAIHALVCAPDQLDLLRNAPALVPGAVEELLRFDSPVQFMMLKLNGDFAIRGTTIPRGQPVLLGIGSANRDEARFVDPDRLDVTRAANPHLSFGHGALKCVGAALARLEAGAAIGALARRTRRPAILGRPRLRTSPPVLRGFESLILALGDD